jgi:hypothetical protein
MKIVRMKITRPGGGRRPEGNLSGKSGNSSLPWLYHKEVSQLHAASMLTMRDEERTLDLICEPFLIFHSILASAQQGENPGGPLCVPILSVG